MQGLMYTIMLIKPLPTYLPILQQLPDSHVNGHDSGLLIFCGGRGEDVFGQTKETRNTSRWSDPYMLSCINCIAIRLIVFESFNQPLLYHFCKPIIINTLN